MGLERLGLELYKVRVCAMCRSLLLVPFLPSSYPACTTPNLTASMQFLRLCVTPAGETEEGQGPHSPPTTSASLYLTPVPREGHKGMAQ